MEMEMEMEEDQVRGGGKKGAKTGKRKNRDFDDDEEVSDGVSSRTGRKKTKKTDKKEKTKKTKNTIPVSAPSFKRGGDDTWVNRDYISITNQVPPLVADFIASVSTTCIQALDQGGQDIIQTLVDLVTGKDWEEKVTAFQGDSLHSIATRCKRADDMTTNTQFVAMINMLQLTCKLERFVSIA
jgi:hypothetical protein